MLTRIKNSIPNTITCLNLISGVIACLMAFNYHNEVLSLPAYQWAFIFIGAAAVFDFCDGAAARLLHAYSDLGKELDSLADLVSFGVAPAFLVYSTMLSANQYQFNWWLIVALAIPVCGALRLARFNIDTTQTTSFRGLPIPSEAIFWIGFVAWVNTTGEMPANWLTALIVLAMSLMMVSNVELFSLKFKNFAIAENINRYIIICAAIVFVCIFSVPGLMWTILFYIFLSSFKLKVEVEHSDK